jgi:asparaginyl-tRNA synthetase
MGSRAGDLGDRVSLQRRHLEVSERFLINVIRIRATLFRSARRFFDGEGWTEVTVPTLASLTGSCEDPTTLFSLDYFNNTAYLIQTSQLHLETLIHGFGKVYSINHSYRAEPRATNRHLTEFILVEAEAVGLDLQDLLDVQERLVKAMCEDVISERTSELESIGADIAKLQDLEIPFDRITYDAAIERLQDRHLDIEPGDDLGSHHERTLCEDFGRPFFVTHYPKQIKFFNMKEDPDNRERVLSSDLILPGPGEVIGASVREDDPEKLRTRLLQSDMIKQVLERGAGPEDYDWYLQLESVPHAGFGLGFDRFVQWVCDLPSILYSTEFPRNSEHLAP